VSATPEQPPFSSYQYEIYGGGLAGQPPELPIAAPAWEEAFREAVSPEAFDYIAGGAGAEQTMRANLEALNRRRIVPRMLVDADERELAVTLFGARLPAPVLLAPVGVQGIVHPEGELASARAAASLGVPIVLSTAATRSIEEVAEAYGSGTRWFQLYWGRDREIAASLVSRAEAAGYGAIVVTLDNQLLAWRPRDLRTAYLPFLQGIGIAQYLSDPVFRSQLAAPPEDDLPAAVGHWLALAMNPALGWDDLAFLRSHTELPILLKGILHPHDARRAVDAGMDGVIVSNHGGRQLDGAIGALDALPPVVAAVPDGFPVLFDSGIRTGSDVLKALALGARAVLLGRPYVWGLGAAGEDGVRTVLRCLLAELDLALGLSGHRSVTELSPELLVEQP
jgi:isopentenyl diphosphate isomerase/L-lactate dehydrogenase-like FMN-dependent dehydrogenase